MKSLILAAGRGTRINEITKNHHKCLIKLQRKPLKLLKASTKPAEETREMWGGDGGGACSSFDGFRRCSDSFVCFCCGSEFGWFLASSGQSWPFFCLFWLAVAGLCLVLVGFWSAVDRFLAGLGWFLAYLGWLWLVFVRFCRFVLDGLHGWSPWAGARARAREETWTPYKL